MSQKHKSRLLPKGALIEYLPRGNYVKVSAVDPLSAEEVSIVGDPAAGSERLAREAVKKLEYVIAKKRGISKGSERKLTAEEKTVPRAKRPATPSGWDL